MNEKHRRLVRWRKAQWQRQGCRCHYCSARITLEQATLEHIVPSAFGGPDAIYNLTVVCSACNNERGHGLQICKCSRCLAAVEAFHKIRRGRRSTVQHLVYVGDRYDIKTAYRIMQERRDRLAEHAENPKLDGSAHVAVKAARDAYNQAMHLLVQPVDGGLAEREGAGLLSQGWERSHAGSIPAPSACPTCGATGGFHDDAPHVAAVQRMPEGTLRRTNTELRNERREARRIEHAAWAAQQPPADFAAVP